MKLLITGAKGQLGHDITTYCKKTGITCIGASHSELDVTERVAVDDFITLHHPDAVIHCAAYDSVDQAEENEELCRAVNVEGTQNVALACKRVGAKMLYISTDYVFDGEKPGIYDTEDAVGPLSVYGKSKADGEKVVMELLDRYYIVRTSWLFGESGKNFVRTILNLAKARKEITVVYDQVGSPTYTADLAPLLVNMAQNEKYGIYHATNEGFCSWAEFAKEIIKQSQLSCKVIPIKSSEYPTKAVRPKNSRLSKEKLLKEGFYKLPDWQDGLKRFLKQIGTR
ncbi:MAG: dTDP-4-dehydrorhamnose reductase [Oscillospiraceae bacterium]|jgi:dTDP-4-dehydrorhamnose reductase